MQTQSLTLNLPDPIYWNLKHRAERSRRSVEEETIDVLTTAVPGGTPAESWPSRSARNPSTGDVTAVLETLRQRKQGETLTDVEAKQLELATVWEDCRFPNWDGHGAVPVVEDAVRNAFLLLTALPAGCPLPSVGVEPDGHLTLEWYRDPRWTLSISVSPEGELFYAALFAANDVRGREVFQGEIPDYLLNLIRRACTA